MYSVSKNRSVFMKNKIQVHKVLLFIQEQTCSSHMPTHQERWDGILVFLLFSSGIPVTMLVVVTKIISRVTKHVTMFWAESGW